MVRKKLRENAEKSWAWKIDANDLRRLGDDEIKAAFDALMPLQTPDVSHFVDSDDDDITVLVGPKGSGKTFLLFAKSFRQRRRMSPDVKFYPVVDLIDRVGSGGSLSEIADERPDMWRHTSRNWSKAWTIAISAIAFEVAGLKATLVAQEKERFAEFFPDLFHHNPDGKTSTLQKHNITYFLRQAMLALADKQGRKRVTDLHSSVISPCLNAFRYPIVFFLDAPDEALDPDDDHDHEGSAWIDMQLGLLMAIRSVQQVKHNLHIYATLRDEVYKHKNLPDQFQQAKGRCLDLSYSKAQLAEIFLRNCEADAQKWYEEQSNDPVYSFLGLTHIEHSCVVKKDGTQYQEPAIDRIIRHTFHRPRDLMEIGKAISIEQGYSPANLKSLVNDVSDNLLKYTQNQSFPKFDLRYLRVFSLFSTNVLSRRLVEDTSRRFLEQAENKGLTCPFNYLYRHGLLGKLRTIRAERKQQFYLAFDHSFENTLPKADWYFLHPSTNVYLANSNGQSFVKHHSVICGHECDVPVLEILKFELIADSFFRVEFEGQPLMDGKTTLPKGLLIVIAHAQSESLTGLITPSLLEESCHKLIQKGWLARNSGISECVHKFAFLHNTDQSKTVNHYFKRYSIEHAISTSGGQISFNVCDRDQITFMDENIHSKI